MNQKIKQLGFVISLPFAPASQTMYMRVYAVSIPFLIFISIYGMDFIFLKLPFNSQSKNKTESLLKDGRIFSAIVAFVIIISPAILSILNIAPPEVYTECSKGLATGVVFFNPNSVINVVEDNRIFLDWVPNTHQEKFRRTAHNICCKDAISFYESRSAPISIFSSIDNFIGNYRYFVIADSDMLPSEAGWLQLCGSAHTSEISHI